MLSLMRKHATSWLIKIILAAIVIVFVLWGVGSFTSQRSGRVATVNGESITLDEYRTTYKRLIDQVRRNFGNNLNDELIERLQLSKKALDQLVDKKLLLQAAEELDLRISDEELSRAIKGIQAFQVAGVFNSRQYQIILGRNNLSPEDFEASQRALMLLEKVNNLITASVKVSDPEALQWYRWNNAGVDLEFVLFAADRYKDVTVSQQEIEDYYNTHKETYKTEPKIKVRYVKFDPTSYVSGVKIPGDEIQEYYDDHPDEFETPKTVEARHILIKLDRDADPEKVAEAKTRIEKILKMAREGQDFSQLAKKFSEGPSKDRGGYLGSFKRESMVQPFADKAFSMQVGEISDPVRTSFGWHIIKVEKVNAAVTKSLADARSGIRKKLAGKAAKRLAYDAAESAYDATYEGEDLESVARQQGVAILTTDFFSRRIPAKGTGKPADFAKAAFELPEGEISEIQDFGDGYYLLEGTEKMPASIPELKIVEAKVKADLINEKKNQQAKKNAQALLDALKNGTSLPAAAKQFGQTPKATGFFKRREAIPNVGYEPDISRVAFELSDHKRLPSEVLKGRKGYYVIRFKARQAPAVDAFAKEKTEIVARLLQQKQVKTMDAWLKQMRSRSEIVIEDNFAKNQG
jgi:peptidyl-prolyl cis-trans isomerase D